MIVSTALICMAMNVYNESRFEPIQGQFAVAIVTFNRAKRDPENVCEEVFKPKQFSWANNNVTKTKTGWKIHHPMQPHDLQAFVRCLRIANITLAGGTKDLMANVTHFHSIHVKPVWASKLVVDRRLGNHIFYSLY